MADEAGAQGATENQATDTEDNQPTNRDIKESELFRKLASENAEMKRAQEEREEADKKAQSEAEIKAMEDKGQFEEALKLRDAEIERLKETHSKEILNRDLTTELLKAGFNNDTFLAGAVAGFDSNGNIAEYVKSLVGNETNKPFLGGTKAALTPPGTPSVGGSASPMAASQIKELQNGSLDDRAKARDYLKKYYAQNGKMPDGF